MTQALSVLFEDECVIAIDKPDGLLLAPDRWDQGHDNLMRRVHDRFSPSYFNVHNMDRETSGIVLCAKTKEALMHLSGRFESGHYGMQYAAITRSVPAEDKGSISLPIAADPERPGRMRTESHGKPSETRFEVVEHWLGIAYLRVTPLTNRTHQIRVHLAACGTPIVGDALYGDGRGLMLSEIKPRYKQTKTPEIPLVGRLALHAQSVTFNHPVSHEPMTIQSPLPEKFEIAFKYLRRYATSRPPR